MDAIQVRGYSERGMINSICYEIRYSPIGPKLLREFLGLCTFPHLKPNFANFSTATLVIEQSFSDFGDLDLLILLQGDCTQAVCIEAKVKTDTANYWSLEKEWETFRQTAKCGRPPFQPLYAAIQENALAEEGPENG